MIFFNYSTVIEFVAFVTLIIFINCEYLVVQYMSELPYSAINKNNSSSRWFKNNRTKWMKVFKQRALMEAKNNDKLKKVEQMTSFDI